MQSNGSCSGSTRTSEEHNKRGNRAFERKSFPEAVTHYSEAINLNPTKHTYYSNRVAALCALQRFDEALKDAERAIELAPTWAKGYARKGTVLWYLNRLPQAKEAFMQAARLEPDNSEYRRKIAELEENVIEASSAQVEPMSTSQTSNQTTALTMLEDFECVLCFKLLYEPVTTPCGHTFCRSCLFRALDHASNCPLCRAVIHIAPTHPVTITLQNIIKKLFPGEYAQRAEEHHLENVQNETCMPLFPLNAVVFPGTRFPMHIFEPRYRLMIRRCMAGAKIFGLINIRRDSSGTSWVPYDVGCTLEITKITMLVDGRSYIETRGTRRFRILEKREQDGYMVGKVQWIDEDEISSDEIEHYRRLVEEARALLSSILSIGFQNENIQKLLAQAGDVPGNDQDFSFWLASLLPVSTDTKQELLELQNTSARFERVIALIRSTLATVAPHHQLPQQGRTDARCIVS
jgi:Lon protease-like protein